MKMTQNGEIINFLSFKMMKIDDSHDEKMTKIEFYAQNQMKFTKIVYFYTRNSRFLVKKTVKRGEN